MTRGKRSIICKSVHHQNTAKVAAIFADVMQADLFTPEDVSFEAIQDCELIGFGSGIYFGRFHSSLRHLISQFPVTPGVRRRAFVFSTSGLSILWRLWHWPLKRLLSSKGFDVVGEFHCRGYDTVGPLWLFGGLNHRHPDKRDLDHATEFASKMVADCSDSSRRHKVFMNQIEHLTNVPADHPVQETRET